MTRQPHYKDCYKLVKERIITYTEVVGQSPVLAVVLRGSSTCQEAASGSNSCAK